MAGNPDPRRRRNVECDVVEHLMLIRVSETDALEGDGSGWIVEGACVCGFRHLGFDVEQCEGPFRAGKVGLQAAGLATDPVEWSQ